MAVRDAAQLKAAAQALLADAGPDYGIDPSEVRALLVDFVDSVPALASATLSPRFLTAVDESILANLAHDLTHDLVDSTRIHVALKAGGFAANENMAALGWALNASVRTSSALHPAIRVPQALVRDPALTGGRMVYAPAGFTPDTFRDFVAHSGDATYAYFVPVDNASLSPVGTETITAHWEESDLDLSIGREHLADSVLYGYNDEVRIQASGPISAQMPVRWGGTVAKPLAIGGRLPSGFNPGGIALEAAQNNAIARVLREGAMASVWVGIDRDLGAVPYPVYWQSAAKKLPDHEVYNGSQFVQSDTPATYWTSDAALASIPEAVGTVVAIAGLDVPGSGGDFAARCEVIFNFNAISAHTRS